MKKRIRSERLSVGGILEREAKKLGIELVLEPRWRIAGQITTAAGTRRYFRSMALDLNTQGSAAISTDKDYAAYFLKSMDYPVPAGRAFYSKEWCKEIGSDNDQRKAIAYAKKIGFPVIAKPNSKSQGRGVRLAHTPRDLARALKEIFTYDRIALVQKPVIGRDYRIVVLDGEIISAYERIALSVLGDGRSSILALLKQKQREYRKIDRDTSIKFSDPRIPEKLARQKLRFSSVPPKNQRVFLLDNANLSSGGDAVDVTATMHPRWRKLAAQIAQDMNLRFTGIDIITPAGLDTEPSKYWILEVNDSPGLDHYAAIGAKQQQIVAELYRKVLAAMARGHE